MIALTVTLRVKPGHLDGFLDAITANAEATFAEPGCRYFDINQALDDDHTFTFYELYVDEEAAAAHRTYPHFARWREAVGEHVLPGSQVNTLARTLTHHGPEIDPQPLIG